MSVLHSWKSPPGPVHLLSHSLSRTLFSHTFLFVLSHPMECRRICLCYISMHPTVFVQNILHFCQISTRRLVVGQQQMCWAKLISVACEFPNLKEVNIIFRTLAFIQIDIESVKMKTFNFCIVHCKALTNELNHIQKLFSSGVVVLCRTHINIFPHLYQYIWLKLEYCVEFIQLEIGDTCLSFKFHYFRYYFYTFTIQ